MHRDCERSTDLNEGENAIITRARARANQSGHANADRTQPLISITGSDLRSGAGGAGLWSGLACCVRGPY